MRDDPTKSESFQSLDLWKEQKYNNDMQILPKLDPTGQTNLNLGFTSNSLSSYERNRMFLRMDQNFADLTLVSGADDLADGRSFALLDFDNDGWQDIALMSLNAPRFKLFRNGMHDYYPENKPFRFQLVGGQRDAQPSQEYSNRDAIGARVLVTFESGKKVMMHKQAGEGFASQNSNIKSIGIPAGDSVVRLDVRWPSGKTSVIDSPDNENVVTIEERPTP